MQMNKNIKALVAAALVAAAGAAAAAPVDTTFTVTGTTGDWTLDFDVANNMTGTSLSLYFFGVAIDGGTVVGNPLDFSSTAYPTWNNVVYGGSDLTYNGVWINNGHVDYAGENLDGFLVHSTSVDAPTAVEWFALFSGSQYSGLSSFSTEDGNPGFVGSAASQVSSIPEPSGLALVLAGLGVAGFLAKRRVR
jgi:hypothetical protein